MKKMFLTLVMATAAMSASLGKFCDDARNEYKNYCIAQKCANKSDKREKAKCEDDCGIESRQQYKCTEFDDIEVSK